MPNFPETSPQEYYAQEMVENEPEQVQEFQDIQEVPIQQSEPNNQNEISSSPYQTSPENYTEDILLQSSLGTFESDNTYKTQIIQNELELEPVVAQPIYQSAQLPMTNMDDQNINLGEYNNNINQYKSYSYPVQNNNNINSNQQFAKVLPMTNYNSYTTQYLSDSNPQNIQNNQNQNIIYSTPIQPRQNINNQNNINNLSSPFAQSQQKITPISYVGSNSNFGSGIINEFENNNTNNINNINNGMKNLNLSDKKNEVTIKLKGKNNNINNINNINNTNNNINITNNLNKSNFLKSNNLNNTKSKDDFSRDAWTLFYPEDDPFFTNINDYGDSIPNQRMENPGRNEVYIGEVNKMRQKHGYGKLYTPEFEREGTWKNDRFNGWGREIRKNGEIYEGKFVNDSLNGKGKYKNRNVFYIGDFVNYDQHGKGELFTNEYHYTGDFVRNGFHGYGIIELYDIGVYEGEFKNKEITGYGIFKYNNGDFYEGDFIGGKKEGFGKFRRADGRTFEGEFDNDEFVEQNKFRNKKSYFKKSYK